MSEYIVESWVGTGGAAHKRKEEIVRCRDCRFADWDITAWWCTKNKHYPFEIGELRGYGERSHLNGFCAWADKKEDKVAENIKEKVELTDGLGNVLYSYEQEVGDGFDPVNRPEHYCSGTLECIDWIRALLTEEEFNGYLKGNALKYIWRYDQKDKENPKQDLKKAVWYLNKLCEVIVL